MDIERNPDLKQFLGLLVPFKQKDYLHQWVEWVGKWGISRTLFLSMLFFGLCFALSRLIPNFWIFLFSWIAGTFPLWGPVFLGVAAWKVWKIYIFSLNFFKSKFILIEMKVPRDVTRSPRAMELALTQLWISSGETQFIKRHWQGNTRPYFSLEIASFGGDVHMYIWCKEWDKIVFEQAIYAYYPEVELHVVEDYATKFQYDPDKYTYFTTDHILNKGDAYPIKTYIDFELDKDPKEEFRIDPIAQVLETMSNLKPQEQMWAQIVLTMSKDKRVKPGTLFVVEDRFTGMIKDEVENIRYAAMKKPKGKPDDPLGQFPHPTWSQQEQIKAMERHMGKLPFNVGFRACYIAEKKYASGSTFNGMRWLWRPMGALDYMNQLKPANWHNTIDYPWQDFMNFRERLMTQRFLDAYRRRSYFYPPWPSVHHIMTPEAIATLWHPPSRAAAAPGLQRIPATKAEPPSNLPR